MNYKMRLFTEINPHVYDGMGADKSKYAHVDIHIGNLAFEMEKSLTPEQMNEFIITLQKYSNRKAHEEHMRNFKGKRDE